MALRRRRLYGCSQIAEQVGASMELLRRIWSEERQTYPLWTPVFLGLGVWLYFVSPIEPPLWLFPVLIAAPIALWVYFRGQVGDAWLLWLAVLIVAIGFALGGARARLVEAPVLASQMDAAVEGVVREVNRTRTGRPRLVLSDLVIFGLDEADTPRRAQVSLQREEDLGAVLPGDRVSVFAHLGPPGGPVEPGGFDYRRTAWFLGLGAVGYARGAPVEIDYGAEPGAAMRASLALARQRARLGAALRERMPGEAGAFAAAVTVGDRAGISADATQALRDANLAHLLAISGLHMGLVTALVFAAARLALAALSQLIPKVRAKPIAAAIALAAAIAYLGLSGASIATQRAFIMAAVALIAVMLNRPAITLRALAVAAIVILAIRPESVVHVGFQMSFAATAAIIAGFDYAREKGWSLSAQEGGLRRRLGVYVLALAATSLLAGFATSPFAAYHFNRLPHYGLIANLVAVPMMGFVIAPAALIAAALAPLGLADAALFVMGRGIDAIIWIARLVAGLDGAVSPIAAAHPAAIGLMSLGGLALCIGRKYARAAGSAGVLAGFVIWAAFDMRPTVLIAPEGRLIGVLGPEGRALDHAKTGSYAARSWLEADGESATQEIAAARPGVADLEEGSETILSNGWRIVVVASRRPDHKRLAALCAPRVLLVAGRSSAPVEGPCLFYGRENLEKSGALAVEPAGDDIAILSAAEAAGHRLWTRRAPTPP